MKPMTQDERAELRHIGELLAFATMPAEAREWLQKRKVEIWAAVFERNGGRA